MTIYMDVEIWNISMLQWLRITVNYEVILSKLMALHTVKNLKYTSLMIEMHSGLT